MHSRTLLRMISTAAVASTSLAVGLCATPAQAVERHASIHASVYPPGVVQLSADDWRRVATSAAARGDGQAAMLITRLVNAHHLGGAVRWSSLPASIFKKIFISLLRYGGASLSRVVSKIAPRAARTIEANSGRIARFLEGLNNWERGPIVIGLMRMGIPYDVAVEIADFIVMFVGL